GAPTPADVSSVAVRNTNPRRIRRYAKLVEIVLPSGRFRDVWHEKAAGDHASGQSRVRKWMRVEMSPAPVGACYQPIGDISAKNETQEPLIARLSSDRGGAATLVRDAEMGAPAPGALLITLANAARVVTGRADVLSRA
ncbi:hypothetical protein, partial [Bradyrhizobium guangdongense]|uniref:hypothetical protein n=1 Tax=Bradyrhizobium guangdongense TaxID=1325090 RepID=UPI001AECB616